jgi:glycosyltransferase involved in cell wall biosynthesis
MKLLILTQKVDKNDSVLGFFHSWLEKIAQRCDSLIVVALEVGVFDLPANVRVLSLGKKKPKGGSFGKIKYVVSFYRYIWRERKNYEIVFIHMNPEYAVLGGWLWWLFNKKVFLWYVHRQWQWWLGLGSFFCRKIFTVSPQTCPLKNNKVVSLGHGIDTAEFCCDLSAAGKTKFFIISVGRITRIKNLETLIEAGEILAKEYPMAIEIKLFGAPITADDQKYQEELNLLIKNKRLANIIFFAGTVPYNKIKEIYCQSDLMINLAPSGGIDKAVLEAMSCSRPVLVANESFRPFFDDFAGKLIFKFQNSHDLAEKIKLLMINDNRELVLFLKNQVAKYHNLDSLIYNLVDNFLKN